MLELVDRLGVPVVVFALHAIVNLAAEIKLSDRCRLIGHMVAAQDLFSDLPNADPLDTRGGSCKIAIDQLMIQPNSLEDLGATIRLYG